MPTSERGTWMAALQSEPPTWIEPMYVGAQVVGCAHRVRCWRNGDWWVYQHGESPEARFAIRKPVPGLNIDREMDQLREWVAQVHAYERVALVALGGETE